MAQQLSRDEDYAAYCPRCLTCLSGAPESCPECGIEREGEGWKPLELSPQPYLGYQIDERYLLDRFLGGGASGEVYRAVDTKLDRPFALKIVELGRNKSEDAREEHARRFRNEVQALSRLRNPHVINIYESFRLDEHTAALLTEYIDGMTLEQTLEREGVLSFDRAIGIMRQIANGLHEAHEQGVVHRDLKPGNIMIEQLPASGQFARLLDFGLVRMLDDVSQTRGFRGTPLYAAPEQCDADTKVDRRADLYALACVMFHAITGEPPFYSNDPVDVMESHTSAEPPTLSEASSHVEIPERLDELFREMLHKDPGARPESLQRVIEVLDEIAIARQQTPEQSDVGHAETTEVEPLGKQSTVGTLDEEPEGEAGSSTSSSAWETRTGDLPAELLQTADLGLLLTEYTPGATAVRLEERGGCITLADGDHLVHLVARGTHDYDDSFEGARMRITAVTGRPARGGVFAAEMNGRILRWGVDLRSKSQKLVVDVAERVLAMDVDLTETGLLVGTERGEVLRYDVRTAEVSHRAKLEGPVCKVRFGPDGERGVAATMTGEVAHLAFDDGEVETRTVAEVDREVAALAVDRHGDWAAILDRSEQLHVQHLRDLDRSFVVAPVPDKLRSVIFTSNGQLMGVSLADAILRIWAFHHAPVPGQLVAEE